MYEWDLKHFLTQVFEIRLRQRHLDAENLLGFLSVMTLVFLSDSSTILKVFLFLL